MDISMKVCAPGHTDADLMALAVKQLDDKKKQKLPAGLSALDEEWGGVLAALVESGDFTGKAGQQSIVHPVGDGAPTRVLLLGLGDKAPKRGALRTLAARAVRRGMELGAEHVALCLPSLANPKPQEIAEAIAEGALLAGYRFDQYREKRDEDPKGAVERFELCFERCSNTRAAKAGLSSGVALGESQNLARDLSNEPPNELHPAALARHAQKVAREVGLKCKVLDVPAMKKLGMGGVLAVGQGSNQPPRMIILEHNAPKRGARAKPTLCVVGKGITFDTGGISLKPGANMHEMKHDMSGAAAVVGAMRAAALLKLPLHVVGIIAAAENMPGGNAYRPGDVVTTMSGKTIEILNTDAEGRVVLADALHYGATEYEPKAMVDLATLTGACLVALGPWHTGLFSEDDDLVGELERAAKISGEPVWRLPLGNAHKKAVQSKVADLQNVGGRDAGASTAAAFLSHFAGDVPWAHLDIAGTGWTGKSTATQPPGASGVGVRMVIEWLRSGRSSKAKATKRSARR